MGLINLIDSSKIVSLDTNIFILALDNPGSKGESARILLDKIKQASPKIFISVLLIEEFFVKVYKQNREKDTADILEYLSIGGLAAIIDVNRNISLLAAKIRADYKTIKTPDAVHIATAIESKAKVFITTDKRLPKKIGKLVICQLVSLQS